MELRGLKVRNGGGISTEKDMLDLMRVEWDGGNNVEQMWEPVKRAMIESKREMCGREQQDRIQRVCGGM